MACDETLVLRLRAAMESVAGAATLTEKRMFGGVAMLLNGNMACGIVGDKLMVRVGPDAYEECLELPHVSAMDFTGRPMRGFLFVWPEGIATARSLGAWVARGADFAHSLPAKTA
jgi:hypothetical protein